MSQKQTPNQRLTLVKNPSSFDLVIPQNVEAVIRHLCTAVHDVEWSGTLFYKVEGSLDDGTFKATCLDICVLDIGSAGYTEFKDTSDILSYRIDHNLLGEGIYEALIHSHNNMNAFFSGTDSNTLIDEGTDLNHFLSLVVCNAGQYVARITRKLTKQTTAKAHVVYTTNAQYDTYGGKTIVLSTEQCEKDLEDIKESTVVEYFDLNIKKECYEEPFAEINERLRNIRNTKRTPTFSSTPHTYGSPIVSVASKAVSRQLDIPGLEEKETTIKSLANESSNYEEARTIKNVPTISTKLGDTQYNPDEDDESPFYGLNLFLEEKVPEDIIDRLTSQLLLGDLFFQGIQCSFTYIADNLDAKYEKRFGDFVTDPYIEERIRNWIGTLVEQLITYSVNKKFEDSIADKYSISDYYYDDTDEFIKMYAFGIISKLKTLSESSIKELMIEELEQFLPMNYDSLLS